jgi:ATP-dependent helicase/nuclease subunit B
VRIYYYDHLGSDIRSHLVRECVVRAEQGKKTLYLAPSREVIFAVRDQIESLHGGIMHIQVGGMEDLERRLQPAGSDGQRIDQSTAVRMVQHIMRQNRQAEPYRIYAAAADQEGLARLLYDQIKRTKRENLYPDALAERLAKTAVPAEKAPVWALLLAVYRAYQELLEKGGLCDVDDVAMRAARAQSVDPALLPDYLVLDGYINVDRVHRDMLATLFQHFPEMDGAAGVPFYTESADGFLQSEIIADLQEWGFVPAEKGLHCFASTMVAADLARNLFALDAPKGCEAADIQLLDAPCQADEVRQVLKEVRNLLMTGQTVPPRVAIVVRDLDQYQDNLAHIARELAIPLHMTHMQPLVNSHTGKDLLRIVSGLANGKAAQAEDDTVLLNRTDKSAQALEWLRTYWPEAAVPSMYCQRLLDWLQRACLLELLTDLFAKGEIRAEWLQRELTALQVLEQMVTDMQISYTLLPDMSEMATQDFYLELLREMEERSVPGVRSTGGVKVLDPDLLRGVSYDYVFFMGLNDGVFPRTGTADLFSAPFSASRATLPVANAGWELEREKIRFTMVCAAARCRLTLSYRTANEDGSFLLPSSFLQDAAQLLGRELKTQRTMRDRFYLTPQQMMSLEELLGCWAVSGAADVEWPAELIQGLMTMVPDLKARIQRIHHGANVERQRFSTQPPDMYDGLLAGMILPPQMADYAFSASQLNDYRLCPFRYFASRILGLRKPEEDDEITPLYLGNLYHRVLAGYYLREPFALELQAHVLADCLSQVMNELESFQYNRLFLTAKAKEIQDHLMEFLTDDLEKRRAFHAQTGHDLRPTYLEWSVDDDTAIPGCRLRAHVDRVDLEYENGTATGRYVVYDYKRKSVKSLRDILKGDDLQLPVYVLLTQKKVARELKRANAECMGALFYSITKKERKGLYKDDWREALGFSSRSRGIHADQWDTLMDGFRQRIQSLAERIRTGDFTLPGHCPLQGPYAAFRCDFENMCRYHPERMAGKGGGGSGC